MKTLIMLLCLVSVASAATYKWEDKDGMHFTDNLESVPAQYQNQYAEADESMNVISTGESLPEPQPRRQTAEQLRRKEESEARAAAAAEEKRKDEQWKREILRKINAL